MTVYTLLQTDTDIAGPAISVYWTAEEAIAVGKSDIRANGTRIIDEGTYENVVWTCCHTGTDGIEFTTQVQRHELKEEK